MCTELCTRQTEALTVVMDEVDLKRYRREEMRREKRDKERGEKIEERREKRGGERQEGREMLIHF